MRNLVKVLIIFGAILALLIFVITVAVVQISKDTNVVGGHLVTKGTELVVETASAETQVQGATLQNKHGDTLGTVTASKSMPLSSSLPDATFSELRVMSLTSPSGAHLQLTVLGFVRLPGRGVNCGNITTVCNNLQIKMEFIYFFITRLSSQAVYGSGCNHFGRRPDDIRW